MRKIIEWGAALLLIAFALGLAGLVLWPKSRVSQDIVSLFEPPPPHYFAADPGPGFKTFYPVRSPSGERRLVPTLAEVPEPRRSNAGRYIVPVERSPAQILDGPQVTIYAASWCGYCEKMLRELTRRGVDAELKDIERTPEIAAELIERSGGRAIPFTLVDGESIYGFDKERLAAALADRQVED